MRKKGFLSALAMLGIIAAPARNWFSAGKAKPMTIHDKQAIAAAESKRQSKAAKRIAQAQKSKQ